MRFINSILARFGYRLSAWPLAKGIVASSHVAELLARHPCDTLIDVGAHRGETGLKFRSLGFRGRIVSFEPMPDSYARLAQAAGMDGNWIAHRLALGDVATRATMHGDSVLASLH